MISQLPYIVWCFWTLESGLWTLKYFSVWRYYHLEDTESLHMERSSVSFMYTMELGMHLVNFSMH